jgi:hypothetical protein
MYAIILKHVFFFSGFISLHCFDKKDGLAGSNFGGDLKSMLM